MALGRKTGGRVKGTPNKPKPYKQIIYGAISEAADLYFKSGLFQEDINALEPKDRVVVMERLCQYVVPKQQSQRVDVSATANVSATLTDTLNELSNQYED